MSQQFVSIVSLEYKSTCHHGMLGNKQKMEDALVEQMLPWVTWVIWGLGMTPDMVTGLTELAIVIFWQIETMIK